MEMMIYIDSPRLANKKMIFHSYVHLPAEATAPHFVSEIQTIPWSPFDARVARAESGVPTAASEQRRNFPQRKLGAVVVGYESYQILI